MHPGRDLGVFTCVFGAFNKITQDVFSAEFNVNKTQTFDSFKKKKKKSKFKNIF